MKPSTHCIHEYVSGLKVRSSVSVTDLPSFQSGERILFPLRAPDLDEWMLRCTSGPPSGGLGAAVTLGTPLPGGLHSRGLIRLLSEVWRPRRITQALARLAL
jgi:hypothetical protein